MLVIAILSNEIAYDFIHYRLNFLRRHKIVTGFNDHSKNLSNLILLMGLQVTKKEGVEW
jgi:hypothetical protein